MPRFDVTTIGEGQLRYSVPAGRRLAEVNQLDVHVTGTELEARWGIAGSGLAPVPDWCGIVELEVP